MGDPEDMVYAPAHEVCVDEFEIGKFLVTNQEYRRFCPDRDKFWIAHDKYRLVTTQVLPYFSFPLKGRGLLWLF